MASRTGVFWMKRSLLGTFITNISKGAFILNHFIVGGCEIITEVVY